MKQQSPPLYVWFFSVVVFITLQWSMHTFSEKIFPQETKDMSFLTPHGQRTIAQLAINKAHYLEMQEKFPHAFHVVALGSSLTNTNIDCTSEMFHQAMDEYGDSIIVSKIYSPGRPLEIMTRHGNLFETLLQHPPDIFLLESDMMSFVFNDSAKRTPNPTRLMANASAVAQIEGMYLRLNDALRNNRLNLISAIQPGTYEFPPPFFSKACDPINVEKMPYDSLSIGPKKRLIFNLRRTAYAHGYFKQLQKAGTRIVLLDHPRPAALEKMYQKDPQEAELVALIRRYQQDLGFEFWECPLALPFSYYRDRAHMNSRGRDVYSSWLLGVIHEKMGP